MRSLRRVSDRPSDRATDLLQRGRVLDRDGACCRQRSLELLLDGLGSGITTLTLTHWYSRIPHIRIQERMDRLNAHLHALIVGPRVADA